MEETVAALPDYVRWNLLEIRISGFGFKLLNWKRATLCWCANYPNPKTAGGPFDPFSVLYRTRPRGGALD